MSTDEGTPALPHLSIEFFMWLWFASERDGGSMTLPENIGTIDVWVENRLSFRGLAEEKARAVVTGENAASSLEALAALAAGKVVKDIQIHIRREEREYSVTLRGDNLDLAAKLPPHSGEGEDGLLYERMYLYEDLWYVVEGLYKRFGLERTHATWSATLNAIRGWVAGGACDAVPAPDIALPSTAAVVSDEDSVVVEGDGDTEDGEE
ncbi:MAG: hypothetical protein P8R54_15005 [Myxococcota bacterium]|nr:hypothetical protein [Myxococcota bacterium]